MPANNKTDQKQLLSLGRAVIETEQQAVAALAERIDENFAAACQHILHCKGRVVVLGMGKSGHIAGKLAATLASTGTPAFFVHPGEASHGDLGMITAGDVVIALSNSGETEEIITLLPIIKRLNIPLVALTGTLDSTLAKAASVSLDVSVAKEACPLGLAPTASTAASLAMGDALAIALLQARGFAEQDFALAHPGGTLGRRLLLRVDDIMHSGTAVPQVTENTLIAQAILEMSEKGLGMTTVINAQRKLTGIFTDGDLRRALDAGKDIGKVEVAEVMTRDYKTVTVHALAAEALQLMEQHKINALPIMDQQGELAGVLNMHDLLRARVV
ncbi:MAG: KpsF/GutQ family sugar-phosphate isomerase [Gammaproteobacteria bacterium]